MSGASSTDIHTTTTVRIYLYEYTSISFSSVLGGMTELDFGESSLEYICPVSPLREYYSYVEDSLEIST